MHFAFLILMSLQPTPSLGRWRIQLKCVLHSAIKASQAWAVDHKSGIRIQISNWILFLKIIRKIESNISLLFSFFHITSRIGTISIGSCVISLFYWRVFFYLRISGHQLAIASPHEMLLENLSSHLKRWWWFRESLFWSFTLLFMREWISENHIFCCGA